MRRLILLFVAAASIMSAAATTRVKVACVGNSVTYGAGLADREHEAYPAQLQRLLGDEYEVRNFGHNGATLLSRGHRPYVRLPEFRQALDYGAKVAGCTVHFVDAGTDSGPIIVQRAVPILEDDTPETLHARIQEQEHLAFPEALRLLAAGRLSVSGRRVVIAP